ncbi:MAG: retropepsin-like aspartic protease, partial [Aeromonas sp.]
MARPATYSGEASTCSGFLLQCTLYFELHPHQFASERAKVSFIISLLAGRDLQWAEALWTSENPLINSSANFMGHFREVFSQATTEISVHDELLRLRQATSPINDFTLRFRTLAAVSGWNETALLATYRRGLNPLIRQHMAIYDDSVGLESFLQKATHVAQHLTACHMEASPAAAASPEPTPPAPEPMITDAYHLSQFERTRRLTTGLCLYCGSPDHHLLTCPVRPPRPAVSTLHITPSVSPIPYIDALLTHNSTSFPVKVLVDSGASGNFISSLTLHCLDLPCSASSTTYQISTIQGKPLGKGLVHLRTPVVELGIGCFHSERISFLVLEEANVDIVLGRPWLEYHHPT